MVRARNNGIRVMSLFAGCGGLDLGFAQAGYDVVLANDIDPEATEVYKSNIQILGNRNTVVHCGDVWDLLKSSVNLPRVDVVKGGFPCQGFSLAGKRRLDDSRNQLYRALKEAIRLVRPKVFVAENVRGLQNIASGQVLERVVGELEQLGYHVHTYLVDAADFGVPQHRERLFIIGSRDDAARLEILPTHSNADGANRYAATSSRRETAQLDLMGCVAKPLQSGLPAHRTVRDAIGDLQDFVLGEFPDHVTGVSYPSWYDAVIPQIGEGQRLYNFRHDKSTVVHTWEIEGGHFGEPVTEPEGVLLEALSRSRRLKEYKVAGFIDGSPMSAEDLASIVGESTRAVSTRLLELERKGHVRERVPGKFDFRYGTYNQYQRLSWDRPARTLVTNVGNPRNMLHPSKHRAPTVRECARLMSFPDNFAFDTASSAEAKYRMLGNAVPPTLARSVALAIRAFCD